MPLAAAREGEAAGTGFPDAARAPPHGEGLGFGLHIINDLEFMIYAITCETCMIEVLKNLTPKNQGTSSP
jgi:hypothetical protein